MKPLKLVQWAWPIEVGVVTIAWLVILFWLPARMPAFVLPMPYILGFIGAQAGVGFGGKPLKTKLENERANNEISPIP